MSMGPVFFSSCIIRADTAGSDTEIADFQFYVMNYHIF